MSKKHKEFWLIIFGIIISAIFIYWMKPLLYCTIKWASEIPQNYQNIGGVAFTVSAIIFMIWFAYFYWKKVINYIKRENDCIEIVLENIKIQKRIKTIDRNKFTKYEAFEDRDEDYYTLNSYMNSKNKYEGINLYTANRKEAEAKIYHDTNLNYLLKRYGEKKYKRKTAKINLLSKYYNSRIYYKVIGYYFDDFYNKYIEMSFNVYNFVDLELDKYIKNNNITSLTLPYVENIFSSDSNFDHTKLKYESLKYMVENMSNSQILKKCLFSNILEPIWFFCFLSIAFILYLWKYGFSYSYVQQYKVFLFLSIFFSIPSIVRSLYHCRKLIKIKFNKSINLFE